MIRGLALIAGHCVALAALASGRSPLLWQIGLRVRMIVTSMNEMNWLSRMRSLVVSAVSHLRFTFFITLAIGIAAICIPICATATPPVASASANVVPSNPARDQALKEYLQKKFRIPEIQEIQLGPMMRTGLPDLFGRTVTVTNDQGQTARVVMFTDRNETKAIIGQYLDLTSDPWDRTDMRGIHLEDRPTMGPDNAPVTIIEFADFECPFCARAFGQIETLVNTTYKGKVRLIFKDYPLTVHPWAKTAAIAAECARLQNPDAFWDFARYFYTNQGQIDASNIQRKVSDEAGKLKLDDSVLKACMAGPQAAARVNQDRMDGELVKVSSTPTFFLNGISVVGLPEGKVFDFVINSELQKTDTEKAARK